MKKLLQVVIVIAVLVGASAAGYFLLGRNTSHGVKASSVKVSKAGNAGARPEPGTYTYTGSGSEHVDVLGGATHTFPAQLPVAISLGSGCEWTQKIYFVKEHTDTDTLCTDAGGVREVHDEADISFLGIEEKDTYTCPAIAFRLIYGVAAGSKRSWTCTGPNSNFNRTFTDVGPDHITVGGTSLAVEHVRSSDTLSHGKTGTSSFDYWLLPSGLPVKFTVTRAFHSPTPLGATNYTQHATYTITSITPK